MYIDCHTTWNDSDLQLDLMLPNTKFYKFSWKFRQVAALSWTVLGPQGVRNFTGAAPPVTLEPPLANSNANSAEYISRFTHNLLRVAVERERNQTALSCALWNIKPVRQSTLIAACCCWYSRFEVSTVFTQKSIYFKIFHSLLYSRTPSCNQWTPNRPTLEQMRLSCLLHYDSQVRNLVSRTHCLSKTDLDVCYLLFCNELLSVQ